MNKNLINASTAKAIAEPKAQENLKNEIENEIYRIAEMIEKYANSGEFEFTTYAYANTAKKVAEQFKKLGYKVTIKLSNHYTGKREIKISWR